MTTFTTPVITDTRQYTAYSKQDPSIRFTIIATSDNFARVELLAKVGWVVEETNNGPCIIADVDNPDEDQSELKSFTLAEGLEEAVAKIGWMLSEPEDIIGGNLSGGFSIAQQ